MQRSLRAAVLRRVALRLLASLPSLVGVVVISFVLTRALPGDPAAYFAGPTATAASIAQTRHRLGLDRSWAAQFLSYVADLARGDLGNSLTTGQTVRSDLAERLPASLELTGAALLLALAGGIAFGMAAALKPRSLIDQACRAVALVGQATPTFFLGLLLVFVFYFLLGWAPAPLGRLDVATTPPAEITGVWSVDALLAGDWRLERAVLAQLALPVVTLALFGVGPIARMTRAALLEVLATDYIRAARAAGLPRRTLLWTYALRNALVPILTACGAVFSFLLGANILVEKVFGWPGIGAYAVDAVLASDYAPVQGFVVAMAALYVSVNLAIDTACALLDPRLALDG